MATVNVFLGAKRCLTGLTAAGMAISLFAGCPQGSQGAAGQVSAKSENAPAMGRRIYSGEVQNLMAVPGGKVLLFVAPEAAASQSRSAPHGIRFGALIAADAAGGHSPVTLGRGVSTLPGAFAVSKDGAHAAFLADFDALKGRGVLQLAGLQNLTKESGDFSVKTVSPGVDFFGFSPDGHFLAYTAPDGLHLLNLADIGAGEGHRDADILLDKAAATFEFSPDGAFLAWRRPFAAGGALVLSRRLADGTYGGAFEAAPLAGDYGFSPDGRFLALTARLDGPGSPYSALVAALPDVSEVKDGKVLPLKTVRLGEKAGNFAFAPDSSALAYVANQTPGMPYGDLFLSPLFSPMAAEARGTQIGSSVADFRFAPSSGAVAVRENHQDDKGRMWQEFKVALSPGGERTFHQTALPNAFISYLFSPDGQSLAFIKRVKADVNLWRLEVPKDAGALSQMKTSKSSEEKAAAKAAEGDSDAELVAPWSYQYRFEALSAGDEAAKDRNLLYLGDCVREGRECALYAAPADAASANERVKIAQGISGFEYSPDTARLFLRLPRLDTVDAFDVAWIPASQTLRKTAVPQMVDRGIVKDSLVFLDGEGRRVAYVLWGKKRAGVYAADL